MFLENCYDLFVKVRSSERIKFAEDDTLITNEEVAIKLNISYQML